MKYTALDSLRLLCIKFMCNVCVIFVHVGTIHEEVLKPEPHASMLTIEIVRES